MIVVVDLDGTLCDSRHREHHAQAKDWDLFHGALSHDEPNQDVLQLLYAVQDRYGIIGCTGRPEYCRKATEQWLIDHDIPLDFVLMRPDFDYGSDTEVKLRLLMQWWEATGNTSPIQSQVAFILEDRDKMVDAWREAGFNCWQVRPGGY